MSAQVRALGRSLCRARFDSTVVRERLNAAGHLARRSEVLGRSLAADRGYTVRDERPPSPFLESVIKSSRQGLLRSAVWLLRVLGWTA